MNRTTWIIIGALCLLGLGGLIYVTKKDTVNVDAADPFSIITGNSTTIADHTKGNSKAKVIVFEYGDYQCPGCAGAQQNLPKIEATYNDTVLFVFRNYPLSSIHPNALAAASVAEAAGLQGKYWEMHDLLYANRDQWVNASADQRNGVFNSFAKQLGLNIDQFNTDLSSDKIAKKIQTDLALGNKAGVNGTTPTMFINSTKTDTDTTNDLIQQQGTKLMDKLDEALKAAGVTPPTRS